MAFASWTSYMDSTLARAFTIGVGAGLGCLNIFLRMPVGQRVPHPPSTNFEEDTVLPPSKRLKRHNGRDDDSIGDSADEQAPPSPSSYQREIPDSEEEANSSDDDVRAKGYTELESALPPIKTDKEAIAEYEAMRMAEEDIPDDLKTRIEQRSWTRGKSSIYVDAFNLALETVLEDESHLFDEKEVEIFKQWRLLDYEQQYLYVRLFLRKSSTWHRLNKLRYYGDLSDPLAASAGLQQVRYLPTSTAIRESHPGELAPPEGTEFGDDFCFAESSEDAITTLDEASSLLSLEELKQMAKDAKASGKNKSELLRSFRRTSSRQSGLGFVGLRRSDSEQTIASNGTEDERDESPAVDDGLSDANRNTHFLRKITAITGPCIRLSLPTLRLFERVHLVFYRSTEWTDKSLTTIILARISRRNFPEYIVSRSTNIFAYRAMLLEFEASLRTQFRVDSILEMNGNPGRAGLEEVLSIFDAVYPRWKTLLVEEQKKEDRVYESGEGAYLRRFSPAWVYTRILHKGVYVLGRFKDYTREHAVLCELLDQTLFHAARRGAWYQRRALLEEHYMYALFPPAKVSDPEQQKRYWKRKALATCERGLQDRDCHLIYHHDLQKRIRKLEKSLKTPKREQHDFGHVLLTKPIETTVSGIQIKKEHASTTTIRRRAGVLEERPRSTKTIWVDELEDGGECSVESMCLSSYRARGWKGYHAEGGIIRTLFAYLFFDVLFVYIPNVFQTAYQTCPLDLHTDAFYPSRASEINHRLVEIGNGRARELIRGVWERESTRRTCVVGLNWDFDVEDLCEIVDCFDGEALAVVCKVMAQEYRVRGGGIPDLFLWRVAEVKEDDEAEDTKATIKTDADERGKILPLTQPTSSLARAVGTPRKRGEVMFVEVKSENDRLSETQKLWIHVLMGAGIRVELCAAVAREVRVVPVDK